MKLDWGDAQGSIYSTSKKAPSPVDPLQALILLPMGKCFEVENKKPFSQFFPP